MYEIVKSTVKSTLLVTLILVGIFAALSLGVNQVNMAWAKYQEQSALAGCIGFGAPHAVIVNGMAYCYMIYEGSERIMPLERLRELGDPASSGT